MSATVESVAGLVAVVGEAARSAGRTDLAERLARAEVRLRTPERQVLVMGDYKQGKSSLVNALVGAEVCPVDDDIATSVPCILLHGDKVAAALAVDGDETEQGRPALRPVRLAEAQRVAAGGAADGVRWVQIAIPRALLQQGIAIVDTPGSGGIGSPAAALALAMAERSSVVVAVTDATQELTAGELQFLRRAADTGAHVLLALTKTDLTRHWQRIAEINRRHLDEAGLAGMPIIPTSATLRRLALQRDDRELNARSGYAALTRELRGRVASTDPAAQALDEAEDVLTQLVEHCRAERAALRSPEAAARVATELAEARHRADQLRRGTARWQQVLGDGISALTSDAEYDVRTRLRAVLKEIEDAVDAGDPAETWDEIREQLGRRVVEELAAHRTLLQERAAAVARSVAEHFAARGAVLEVGIGDVGARAAGDPALASGDLELSRAGIGGKALTALKGATSSVMMFGLLGSLIGFAAVNPVTIVAGIGMGAKALRDESKRQLAQRRTTARTTARKLVDELTLAETKLTRDAVRGLHRELRDGFTARAEELQASLDAAVKAAQKAGTTAQTGRDARTAEIDATLRRLTALRTDVGSTRTALAAAPPRGTAAEARTTTGVTP
ncbi:dynamin family protein [Pseudonocardia acidicola]|uniref:Dynamin N-terminal domain-containing protein n=1 Tax=Pseudonocardia acidicola TaxID=2724939 RepID=A0ABX1S664_9PSEU|nr:dynamin family protein [Pseudonocardia acidicola]NMH95719.1 hypothetical protein [Pseudonocardia acidicola]